MTAGDLDKMTFDIACPQCEFLVSVRYRDARFHDVLICRGCKANLRLDDNMNQFRKARVQFIKALQKLSASLGKFSIDLRI